MNALFKYCPHCSGALAFQTVADDSQKRHVCTDCKTIHYLNPKIVAGVLPIWEGKLLLAKRAIEPRLGLWNVPAGYMENGESLEDGAQRELWEEAIAKVTDLRLHLVYSIAPINQVYMLFVGDLIDGKFGIGMESLDVKLFSPEEIPWQELAFTSSKVCIKRYLENHKNASEKVFVENFEHHKNS